jgi:hypothetical protein
LIRTTRHGTPGKSRSPGKRTLQSHGSSSSYRRLPGRGSETRSRAWRSEREIRSNPSQRRFYYGSGVPRQQPRLGIRPDYLEYLRHLDEQQSREAGSVVAGALVHHTSV